MKKKCRQCGRSAPEVKFYSVGVIKGKRYYDSVCNECRSKEAHVRIQGNKEWIRELKESRGCDHCHTHYPHYILDFHHVRGDKDGEIWNMLHWGAGRKRIQAEIDKCILLCANCHREKHHQMLVHAGQY